MPTSKLSPYVNKKTLELEIHDHCNLNCITCARVHFKRTGSKLKIEDIASIIKEHNYERVQLMGSRSEPILYPQFKELLLWFFDNNIEVELYTNGTLSPKFWEDINNITPLGKLIINWGLAGNNEEDHKFYRQNSLTKVLENVKAIPNAINVGLFIMFDYNTKGYNNPVTDEDILEIDKPISKYFDGILYIHSGDHYLQNDFKAQKVNKYIIPDTKYHCMGDNVNFLSMYGKLYHCKYQYEAREYQKLPYVCNAHYKEDDVIDERICEDNCKINFHKRIKDKFVFAGKIIFQREFNESRGFNIEYFLKLKEIREKINGSL